MSLRLIVVTAPKSQPAEAEALTMLLNAGLDRLHLRKPGCTEQELARLIEELPLMYHSRITLHDHFALHQRYGLGGVHLNSRNPKAPVNYTGLISRSCHAIAEAESNKEITDYLFLSPLFDSISKQGYDAAFSLDELRSAYREGIIDERVVALGGVSAERLPLIRELGFGGVAILGDLWGRYRSPEDMQSMLYHFKLLRAATL